MTTEPATSSTRAMPAPPVALSLDQQVEAEYTKVQALSGMKGSENREALDALENLYGQQAAAHRRGPGTPPDTTNEDAVEGYGFEQQFPLQGIDPDTGEALTLDHGSRRVLQRLADQHGVRSLVDQAYELAVADGSRPTPAPGRVGGRVAQDMGRILRGEV